MKKLVIFGVGLIGGSLALALRRTLPDLHIVGVGRSGDNLQSAISLGVINQAEHDPVLARMKFVLEVVYGFKDMYITFRKKFIAIKIDNARVRNKVKLAEFETYWSEQGVVKVVTPQGITYRIPKA